MSLARVPTVTPDLGELLALAMYPEPVRTQAALDLYATDPARHVWAWMQDGQPVCAAGLRLRGSQAELLHLGTRPDCRGQGAGRRLLLALMTELNLEALEAETDETAADFYRRCGFEVEPFEGRWGVRQVADGSGYASPGTAPEAASPAPPATFGFSLRSG